MSGLHVMSARSWRRHLGPDADLNALRDRLRGGGSLPEAFHAAALGAGEQRAVTVDGDSTTHAQLDRHAAQFAALLAELGVRSGDLVLISAPTSLPVVVAYLGALRLGATVTLAYPGMTKAEYSALLNDAEPAVICVSIEVAHRIDAVTVRVVLDDPRGAKPVSAIVGDRAPLDCVACDPDAVALLAYTSGSTGRPKGVPLTHANLLSSVRGAMLAWRWDPSDVLVHSLPLVHQHGLGGLHATLLAGSRAIFLSKFEAAALVDTLVRERATILFAVPAMYQRLVDEHVSGELASLRLAVCGSAPLSPRLARDVERVIGQLPLERYGTTESGLDVSNPLDGERRVGTVGFALPGVEAAVVDRDGREVPAGATGEVVVRGPQVFGGYRNESEATAEGFLAGGWFRTGDLGTLDHDGRLTITGRSKDIIISGGFNVYPREVELALEEHRSVESAGVIGLPSDRWGEEVVAAIVTSDPFADIDVIADFARSRLTAYKRPKRYMLVDQLPRNAMGKLQRRELLELVIRADTA